jgi:hypothetical protein
VTHRDPAASLAVPSPSTSSRSWAATPPGDTTPGFWCLLSVSHALEAFIRPGPAGLVSCRSRPWGCALQGRFPPAEPCLLSEVHTLLWLVRRPPLQGLAPRRCPCSSELEPRPPWAFASLGVSPSFTGDLEDPALLSFMVRELLRADGPLLLRAFPVKRSDFGSLEPLHPFRGLPPRRSTRLFAKETGSGLLLGVRGCYHPSVGPSSSHDLSLPELTGPTFR